MRLVALSLLLSALSFGQNVSCSISGTVQDPSGSVVAGAKITLTSEATGFVRTVTTNNTGFFSAPDLTPSTYTLAISAPGFRNYRQEKIEMNSGEQRDLAILHLQLGAVSDTVTVSAEAVSINITSGEKAASLGSAELTSMALRGRDIFDAVSLMPGVVDTSDGREAPGPTSIGNIYIAGGRNDQKNMTVDGVTNLDTGSNGSIHSMPSMDSVAELRVLSSAYAAEFGRNSGGTITVITKGGSKDYHGTGNWYYRHEELNANGFFNNIAGKPRPPYRYNIAGYTIGGPLIIPKINHNRQKLNFFFSQEFQHQRNDYGTKTVTVPSAAERTGDFTNHRDTNGTVIVIRDPLNNKAAFPGNKIPANRITTIGQNVLNIFPLPNYTDPNPSRVYQWNYFTSQSGAYPRRTEILRVDYAPRNNWQMYVRLSQNADEQHTPYTTWVNGSVNFDLQPIIFGQPGRGATIRSTNTFGSLFHEVTIGISQNTLYYYPEDYSKVDRTALGIDIPQRNPANNPFNMIPNMTFGSITNAANPSMSDGVPYWNRNTLYSFNDNISKVYRTHVFKAGMYHERTRKVQFANAAVRGTVRYDRDTTNNALDANDAYANALLGNYDTYAEATGRPRGDFRFTNTEWYLQDTWRATKRLSLDFGVRFYHDPPQYDTQHQLSSFSPSLYNRANAPVLLRPGFNSSNVKVAVDPRTGATYSAGLIGSFAPGAGNPAEGMYLGGLNGTPNGMYSIPALAVAPRIGFAWSLNDRTVIRGGGGIYFDRLQGNPTMDTLPNPPTIYTPTQYYGTVASITDQVGSGLLAPTGTVYSLGSPGHNTTNYNFSISLQRQFGRSTVAEVSYVGSLGRHLIWRRNINPVPLGANFISQHPENRDPTGSATAALPANFLRPYQGYGDIMMYEFAGSSNYNSLQASFSQRMRRGATLGFSYTFSKVLDESDGYSSTVDPFYSARLWNYGPAGFDRSHVFSGRFTWVMPKPGKALHLRPMGMITDGWELSGIVRMVSGAPITPTYSLVTNFDFTGSSSASTRPIVTNPDVPVESCATQGAPCRFGPPGYAAVTVPTLGNVGKGILRGPGTNNWDISIYRNLLFSESKRIKGQIRFETYNTFNHTQFAGVDGSMRFNTAHEQINPLFMQPTSARPARKAQIAARLTF